MTTNVVLYSVVNSKSEYYFSIEKVIYVDTFAHGEDADDRTQSALFKIERYETEKDMLAKNAEPLDVFYTDLRCWNEFEGEANNYTKVNITVGENAKVTTDSGYEYPYNVYIGNQLIRV